MNCQDLIKIIREFPEGAEVLLDIGGEFAPLEAAHVQVADGKIVLTALTNEPEPEAPKSKRKAK